MVVVDADNTLAELVIANPAQDGPMEKFGLDYCCGGKSTSHDAVIEKEETLLHHVGNSPM